MKACIKCSVVKPLEEFYKHPQMADGRLGKCKDCQRAAVQVLYLEKIKDPLWREKEAARHREKSARYRKEGRDSGPEIVRRSRKAWQDRNKQKRRCHGAVARALRTGKLIKQPCEVCGNVEAAAHHEDYSKPLDVRWLCVRHHADRHLELNREKRAKRYAAQSPAP